MNEWNTTNLRPQASGYYLAASWSNLLGRYVTSELWFSHESGGTGWWDRDVINLESRSVPVVAWMPLPQFTPTVAGVPAPSPAGVLATIDREVAMAAVRGEGVPVAEWTDAEWLAAMEEFAPDTPRAVAAAWIARRRSSAR